MHAVTREGRALKLLGKLQEAGLALYLEEQIENRFGIEARPVTGELDERRPAALG